MKTQLFKTLFICAFFLVSPFAQGQIPNYVPTNGLKAYWGFAGNANDYTANANNGTVIGALLTSDRFGNPNSAYSFNGTSDYISTTYAGIQGKNPRAVAFWAKTTISSPGMPAVSWGDGVFPATGLRYDCGFNYLNGGATIDVSNAAITYSTNSSVSDNVWHHYVFQMDTAALDSIEVFQDGSLLTQTVTSFNPHTIVNTGNSYNVQIGITSGNSTNYFYTGQLDDIGIWDRKLTTCEISRLYLSAIQTVTVTSSGAIICAGNSATLSASGANTYTWSTQAQGPNITVAPNSTNSYTATGTNNAGCINSTSFTQSVDICTSIQSSKIEGQDLLIYPNPTNGRITLSGMDEYLGIEIYNLSGDLIYKTGPGKDKMEIDLSAQTKGIYFIKIMTLENCLIRKILRN